jgi:hypothetical protein
LGRTLEERDLDPESEIMSLDIQPTRAAKIRKTTGSLRISLDGGGGE